jgi:hypothetical protein
MSLVSLRNSKLHFYMLTHQTPPGCSATQGHVGARLAASGRLHAGTRHRTAWHTTHDRCTRHTSHESRHAPAIRVPCLLHEQTHARTSTLHLHGRRACAGPRFSSSGCLTPSCGPLDGRLAPTRTDRSPSPPRRSRRCERPHGCCRCRRCRRVARLCAYHGRCRQQGTCESRTGDSDSRPTPLPVSAAVADAGREQRAGRRARRVGGVPTSAAGGARAQKPAAAAVGGAEPDASFELQTCLREVAPPQELLQFVNFERPSRCWKLWRHQLRCKITAGRIGTSLLLQLVNCIIGGLVLLTVDSSVLVVVVFRRTVFVLRRQAVGTVDRRSLGLIFGLSTSRSSRSGAKNIHIIMGARPLAEAPISALPSAR